MSVHHAADGPCSEICQPDPVTDLPALVSYRAASGLIAVLILMAAVHAPCCCKHAEGESSYCFMGEMGDRLL